MYKPETGRWIKIDYTAKGDRVLRDTENRICVWGAGYTDEDWEMLKAKHPEWHESVAYYDVREGGIR